MPYVAYDSDMLAWGPGGGRQPERAATVTVTRSRSFKFKLPTQPAAVDTLDDRIRVRVVDHDTGSAPPLSTRHVLPGRLGLRLGPGVITDITQPEDVTLAASLAG
jgi:hypothetical protein